MPRILLLDDNVQLRVMLRQILESEGYEVLEAGDGKEGLKIYRQEPADLVITDLIMPEKEGIETIRELKKDFPEVKIIAISGGGRIGPEIYLDMAQKLGAIQTLSKPIERKDLLEAVRNILK